MERNIEKQKVSLWDAWNGYLSQVGVRKDSGSYKALSELVIYVMRDYEYEKQDRLKQASKRVQKDCEDARQLLESKRLNAAKHGWIPMDDFLKKYPFIKARQLGEYIRHNPNYKWCHTKIGRVHYLDAAGMIRCFHKHGTSILKARLAKVRYYGFVGGLYAD